MALKRIDLTALKKIDLGFGGMTADSDALGDVFPVAQFKNPTRENPDLMGLMVSAENAEIAEFTPDGTWQKKEIMMGQEKPKKVSVYICQNPRVIVLHRSAIYLQDRATGETFPFDRSRKSKGTATKSWAVIGIVGKDGSLLSKLPLRLCCSGVAGTTFSEAFYHKRNPSFLAESRNVYIKATGDKNPKPPVFYSHFIFSPTFQYEMAGEEQKSPVCKTVGYATPTTESITDFVIKGNSPQSEWIREWHPKTESWVQIKTGQSETFDDNGNDDGERSILENALSSTLDEMGVADKSGWLQKHTSKASRKLLTLSELQDAVEIALAQKGKEMMPDLEAIPL